MNYINDIPLYNKDEEFESVNLVIEICPGTDDKLELNDPGFNRLIAMRKVIGNYPFYYGSFPQTYAGDKDPLDFILFTDIEHKGLDIVKADVIGAIKTIDAGEQDDKIICVECSSSITNVKKYLKQALKFIKTYKGKNADMTISKRLASMEEANNLVTEAHDAWKEHTKPLYLKTQRIDNKSTSVKVAKVRIIKK